MEGADVTSGGVATSASVEDEWLWGWDPTPGIVSLWAESAGSAIVWRRIGDTGQLIREDARFRPWLLLDRLTDLQFLGQDLAVDGTPGASSCCRGAALRRRDRPGSCRMAEGNRRLGGRWQGAGAGYRVQDRAR